MQTLPRDNESAEDYGKRVRRERRNRRLVVLGVIVLGVGVLTLYGVLTAKPAKPIAKVGERCGGGDTIQCESHAMCWEDVHKCVQLCGPTEKKCPAGTTCEVFEYQDDIVKTPMRACRPTQ